MTASDSVSSSARGSLGGSFRGRQLGRYMLHARIGSGGMGDVYLAQMGGFGGVERTVAVKVLREDMAHVRRFVDMFIDELQVLARLSHPNLCAVLDFGMAEDRHFLVLEYLHGESLSAFGKRLHDAEDRVSLLPLAARVAADAARGLHAAHTARGSDGEELQIVHRDVSPQNIFVLYDGVTKVMDFGIALIRGRERRTLVGEVKGNLGYASPEQLSGGDVDPRSDTFSLGVVLWEIAVGARLFRADSDGETVLNVMSKAVDPPGARIAGFPEPLERIILRALARDPKERYQTAAEMADDLEQYLASLGRPWGAGQVSEAMHRFFADRIVIRENLLRAPALPGLGAEGQDATVPDARSLSRRSTILRAVGRRTPVWVMALAALLGALAILVLYARRGDTPTERPIALQAAPDRVIAARPPQEVPAAERAVAEVPPTEPSAPTAPTSATARPARQFGELNVLSTPVYARVSMGGRNLGTTPIYRAKVPVGSWSLRLSAGRESRTVRVQIRPGALTSVSVPFGARSTRTGEGSR